MLLYYKSKLKQAKKDLIILSDMKVKKKMVLK